MFNVSIAVIIDTWWSSKGILMLLTY